MFSVLCRVILSSFGFRQLPAAFDGFHGLSSSHLLPKKGATGAPQSKSGAAVRFFFASRRPPTPHTNTHNPPTPPHRPTSSAHPFFSFLIMRGEFPTTAARRITYTPSSKSAWFPIRHQPTRYSGFPKNRRLGETVPRIPNIREAHHLNTKRDTSHSQHRIRNESPICEITYLGGQLRPTSRVLCCNVDNRRARAEIPLIHQLLFPEPKNPKYPRDI